MKRRTLRRLVAMGTLLGTLGVIGVANASLATGATAHDFEPCHALRQAQTDHDANTGTAQSILCVP